MLNRILLIICIVLSSILIIISSSVKTTFFITEAKNNPNIEVLNQNTNNITSLDLEDYIIGVVAAEMPASFHEEALKAQAVAARTYAVYKMQTSNGNYDVVSDISNQSYITKEEMQKKWGTDYNKYYNKIKESVLLTKGLVMTYNSEVIEAYYFAMSNGYTEDVSLVFSEEKDYLKSVASIYDNADLKNFTVTKTYSKEEICNKLNVSCDNLTFTNIIRSSTNRVNSITVNDKVFKGTNFRTLLNLRSTDFDINVDGNQVIITTRGYGHGVGMSQYGANGMAKAGMDYKEILTYFYKNVKITTI